MQTYIVTITGTQPLLMHNDDIAWADRMEEWRKAPENKEVTTAGDDRTPAFRWIGFLYRNEAGEIIIPTDNIMRSMMEGAAMIMTGKGKKTFKAQSQSGIMPRDIGWPLLLDGKPVLTAPVMTLIKERSFAVHEASVKQLGFTLFSKRARVGQAKHIRVRPRFDSWAAQGELVVIDEQITEKVLSDILEYAGKYKGLGDWRPGSKTPGTFGMFTATIERV